MSFAIWAAEDGILIEGDAGAGGAGGVGAGLSFLVVLASPFPIDANNLEISSGDAFWVSWVSWGSSTLGDGGTAGEVAVDWHGVAWGHDMYGENMRK